MAINQIDEYQTVDVHSDVVLPQTWPCDRAMDA